MMEYGHFMIILLRWMYDHIFNEVVLMELVTEVRWRNNDGMVAGVICTINAVAVLIGKIDIKSV